MAVPHVFYLAFLAALFASGLSGGLVEVFRATRYLATFLPFVVSYGLARRSGSIDRIVALLFTSSAVAVAAGVGLYFLGIELRPGVGQTLYYASEGYRPRAGGLISNTGPYGHLVASFVILGILGAHRVSQNHVLSVRVFTCVLGGLAVVLSSSRGAVVAIAVPFAVAAVAGMLAGRVQLLVVLKFVVGLFVGVFVLSSSTMASWVGTDFFSASLDRLNFFKSVTGGESTFSASESRLASWQEAFSQLAAHPVLGTGPEKVIRGTAAAVDNSFLSAGLTAGLLGGIAFLLFWLSLLRLSQKADRGRGEWLALPLAMSQILIALFLDIQSQWYSLPVGLIALGLLLGERASVPAQPHSRNGQSPSYGVRRR